MRILKFDRKSVLMASEIIKQGGLVIYPTDTVYGVGCDPFNLESVKHIFRVKEREKKPLPILASSLEEIEKIAHLNRNARRLGEKFWPGALTILLKKKRVLPDAVTCGRGEVGVRIPEGGLLLEFIRLCGGLLVGTSANKSGLRPPRTAQEAISQIGKEVDLILDGGSTPIGVSSTVVKLIENKPEIIREGPISAKEIIDSLK